MRFEGDVDDMSLAFLMVAKVGRHWEKGRGSRDLSPGCVSMVDV
jgi:hypothetical protein